MQYLILEALSVWRVNTRHGRGKVFYDNDLAVLLKKHRIWKGCSHNYDAIKT